MFSKVSIGQMMAEVINTLAGNNQSMGPQQSEEVVKINTMRSIC